MQNNFQILIIDFGSQYTLVIRRTLGELGYWSIILPVGKAIEWLKTNKPLGIILSGSNASVYDEGAPTLPDSFFKTNIPILGICYGMQLMAYSADKSSVGALENKNREYGPAEIKISPNALFAGFDENKSINVWASHGDVVKKAPEHFTIIAKDTDNTTLEAITHETLPLWGVQFHPEVIETKDDNKILLNFVQTICKCEKDWSVEDLIKNIQNSVKEKVGDGKAIIGFSGGVDSTTLAAILAPVLKDKLYAFTIDTGALREGEVAEIKEIAKHAGVTLHVIDTQDEFIGAVGTTINAEEKRAKFKEVYQRIFKSVAKDFNATHVLQGTLATDRIESGSAGASALIKSHHNVDLDFGLVEVSPFEDLFKHEVRDLAVKLGLAEIISGRQPFPGPGLFVRVVGIPVTEELLNIVRISDKLVTDILKKHDVYKNISQLIVALDGTATVGVKGDGRVYRHSIIVRAVTTTDFMTVEPYILSPEIRKEITQTVTKHPEIVRVFFDETPKPPATTELE